MEDPVILRQCTLRRFLWQGAEHLFVGLVYTAAVVVTLLFSWILFDTVRHGLSGLSWSFFTSLSSDAGRAGGIAPMLVSTGLILLVCLAASVLPTLATAILLAEYTTTDNRLGQGIRLSLDVLAGVPSIVFGLFGNAFFCIFLGMGFSILSGGLTLACMVLPIMIRSTEASLRALPREYRFGTAALGLTKLQTLFHLLLPAATPGILVGLVLGIARALSETAALIFTSGYVDRMPSTILDSGRALTVHIYDLAMNVPGGEPHAYATALTLILLLLAINLATAGLARIGLKIIGLHHHEH